MKKSKTDGLAESDRASKLPFLSFIMLPSICRASALQRSGVFLFCHGDGEPEAQVLDGRRPLLVSAER